MVNHQVVGISVSYNGGHLHELRRAFIEAAKKHIVKDHSGMDDETQEENYIWIHWLFCQSIAIGVLLNY